MSNNPFAEPKAELDVRPQGDASDAERIRREHLSAETNIKSIGLLYTIGGGFGTLGGMIGLGAAVVSLVFTPEYQEIIRQTPHVEYRTSPVAWVALGIILLLIAFGLIAALVS